MPRTAPPRIRAEPGGPRLDAGVSILCGGLGTRLAGAAGGLPKPMVDVRGRPFLEILVDHAVRAGFRRFLLCAGYKAEALRAHFRDAPDRSFVISEEPRPLGTAGALKLGAPRLRGDDFLVMNGDSYCPLDLSALLALRRARGAAAVLAVVPAGGRRDAGVVDVSPDGRVLGFREKEAGAPDSAINAGVYAFSRGVLDRIPSGRPSSLELDVFPALAAAGELIALRAAAPLYDVGTPQRLEAFRQAYAAGLA